MIDTKLLTTLALNTSFTNDAIIINLPKGIDAKSLILAFENYFAMWAKIMNKKMAVIRSSDGNEMKVSASWAIPSVDSNLVTPQEPQMNIADPMLFTNFDPKVWNRKWVRLLETMIESNCPQVLIRIEDQRQLWCNQLFADVMRSGGNEIVQRSINDFWALSDLERLNQELRNGSDFEISYSARLNDAGLWGALRAQNNVYEFGGTFYRLSTNLECNLISPPVSSK